jgi:hypothetical protein
MILQKGSKFLDVPRWYSRRGCVQAGHAIANYSSSTSESSNNPGISSLQNLPNNTVAR